MRDAIKFVLVAVAAATLIGGARAYIAANCDDFTAPITWEIDENEGENAERGCGFAVNVDTNTISLYACTTGQFCDCQSFDMCGEACKSPYELGETCETVEDCHHPDYGDIDAAACVDGTCVWVGSTGTNCDTDANCEDDHVCSEHKYCYLDVGMGEACDEDCGPGLYCGDDGEGGTVCFAKGGEGDSCSSDNHCLSDECYTNGDGQEVCAGVQTVAAGEDNPSCRHIACEGGLESIDGDTESGCTCGYPDADGDAGDGDSCDDTSCASALVEECASEGGESPSCVCSDHASTAYWDSEDFYKQMNLCGETHGCVPFDYDNVFWIGAGFDNCAREHCWDAWVGYACSYIAWDTASQTKGAPIDVKTAYVDNMAAMYDFDLSLCCGTYDYPDCPVADDDASDSGDGEDGENDDDAGGSSSAASAASVSALSVAAAAVAASLAGHA